MEAIELELRSRLAKEVTINQITTERISLALMHLEKGQSLNAYNILKGISLEVEKIANR